MPDTACLLRVPHTVKVFIVQSCESLPRGLFYAFRTAPDVQYQPYCDDFGPLNMSTPIRFVEQLQGEIAVATEASCSQLVYAVPEGPRALSNAVMLLGSYMMLMEDLAPEQITARFAGIDWEHMEGFRDATHAPADFLLSLADCWSGLHRGRQLGWVARPSHAGSPFWGDIDVDNYEHDDDPLNGDLTEVVPGELFAFRGPQDLAGGALYQDDALRFTRAFAPAFYADTLKDAGVTDVVRLNEAHYDPAAFAAAGIRHHDLAFEDCTNPPGHVLTAFFRIVDAATGAVAVHCKAGLGRTGVLIAIHLMRSHGFTARGAMGWLRIMRPGSVIGSQQRFLCALEEGIRHRRAAGRRAGLSASRSAPDLLRLIGAGDEPGPVEPLAARAAAAASAAAAAAAAELARERAENVSAGQDSRSAAWIRAGW